ncbi:unnamed protein product [Pipistrellus nathusii]|uniref:G2 and S phase-expressed protein 1 N-terminal domain-containing protein n=1 Tax=Pipistrellus nathusii TaxID=59473 RepID=A0ABP0A0L3_PIPNA
MEGGGGGGGSGGPPAGQAGGAETEAPRKEGVLLADETFDFDLSLSSLSASEDDEVFFGPVGHKERCVAASLGPGGPGPSPPRPPAPEGLGWSPLAGEAFVEVYKEARLLALQIESSGRSAPGPGPEAGGRGVERFIQESRLKVLLFEKENEARKSPRSLKRETYCLSDSPAGGPALTPGPPPPPRPALPAEPSPAPPPRPTGPQKKGLSRLPPPRAASVRGRGLHAAEKPPKEKPASPSRVTVPGEQEPHGDKPPDKARAARDTPTLPASGSHLVQGKRSLPAPSKLGLKKTQLRPPGCTVAPARRPCARGSVSGLSAGPCASPAAGRARPSIPADRARPPPPGQPGRAGAPAVRAALPGAAAGCGQSRLPGPAAPAARAPPQPQTPEQGGGGPSPRPSLSSSQLPGPGSARRDALLMSQTKAPPTPGSQFKVPAFPTGDSATPRSSGAWRPQPSSAGRGAPGTPARHPTGPAARTPASTARASGLPTPAGRRLSSLPLLTPNTVPRTLASSLCRSAQRLPPEPRRTAGRAAPGSGGSQAVAPGSDVPSDGSLSPAVPQALRFSPEKREEASVPEGAATELALDAAQPPEGAAPREAVLVDVLLDMSVTPSTRCPLGDPPLIDAPLIDLGASPEAPLALGPGSRPLLDLLVNTPDTDRKTAARPLPGVEQLIDLCSPLIQLSPEADKENVDSPLLKF